MTFLTIICLILACLGLYSIKRSAVGDSGAFGAVLLVVAVLVWVGALIMPAHAEEHHPQALHEKFYSNWMMPDAPRTS